MFGVMVQTSLALCSLAIGHRGTDGPESSVLCMTVLPHQVANANIILIGHDLRYDNVDRRGRINQLLLAALCDTAVMQGPTQSPEGNNL